MSVLTRVDTPVEPQPTFGLPECDAHLIAKYRRMDPELLASILTQAPRIGESS